MVKNNTEEKEVIGELAVQPKVVDEHAAVISTLADEVERGLHGTGRERYLSLGVNYDAVQKEVVRRMRS